MNLNRYKNMQVISGKTPEEITEKLKLFDREVEIISIVAESKRFHCFFLTLQKVVRSRPKPKKQPKVKDLVSTKIIKDK